MPCSLAQTMRHHYLDYIRLSYPEIIRHYYPPHLTTGMHEAQMELRAAPYPYSKMCELCELCELFVKKSHRESGGIFLFLLSIIYSLPSTSGTPEGQLEQPQASGTREALWNGPPLTRGVRGGLRFCGVVRLLERAEEGCEGLKHGYYNLPCVHFLIFLCHYIVDTEI